MYALKPQQVVIGKALKRKTKLFLFFLTITKRSDKNRAPLLLMASVVIHRKGRNKLEERRTLPLLKAEMILYPIAQVCFVIGGNCCVLLRLTRVHTHTCVSNTRGLYKLNTLFIFLSFLPSSFAAKNVVPIENVSSSSIQVEINRF